jgi:hypothetical protein
MGTCNHRELTIRLESEWSRSIQRHSKMDGRAPSPPCPILPSGNADSSPCNHCAGQVTPTSPPCSSEVSKRRSTALGENILQQMVARSSFNQDGFSTPRSKHDSTASVSTRSTMKLDSTNNSANASIERRKTFQNSMKDFQDRLDEQYKVFEEKLNEHHQDTELEDFDWDELEARYHNAIDPKVETEQEIMNECSSLFRVGRSPRVAKSSNGVQHFLIWTQMSSEREADRALKRQVYPITLSYFSPDMLTVYEHAWHSSKPQRKSWKRNRLTVRTFPQIPRTNTRTFANLADRLEGRQRISQCYGSSWQYMI